jgi:hypothetical protein
MEDRSVACGRSCGGFDRRPQYRTQLQYFGSAAIQLVRQSIVGKGELKYPILFKIITSGGGNVCRDISFETWEQHWNNRTVQVGFNDWLGLRRTAFRLGICLHSCQRWWHVTRTRKNARGDPGSGWFNFFESSNDLRSRCFSTSLTQPCLLFTTIYATGGSTSDRTLLREDRDVLYGGTLSRRLSAFTLVVQGTPLHNIRALGASLKGERRSQCGTGRNDVKRKWVKPVRAVMVLMDWWVGPNQKLGASR